MINILIHYQCFAFEATNEFIKIELHHYGYFLILDCFLKQLNYFTGTMA